MHSSILWVCKEPEYLLLMMTPQFKIIIMNTLIQTWSLLLVSNTCKLYEGRKHVLLESSCGCLKLLLALLCMHLAKFGSIPSAALFHHFSALAILLNLLMHFFRRQSKIVRTREVDSACDASSALLLGEKCHFVSSRLFRLGLLPGDECHCLTSRL